MTRVRVDSYEEMTDTFTISYEDGPECYEIEVQGVLLPAIIGVYGEPSDVVDRYFDARMPEDSYRRVISFKVDITLNAPISYEKLTLLLQDAVEELSDDNLDLIDQIKVIETEGVK